jgi:hypothetical protein
VAGEVRDEVAGEVRDEVAGEVRDEVAGEVRDEVAGRSAKRRRAKSSQAALRRCALLTGRGQTPCKRRANPIATARGLHGVWC